MALRSKNRKWNNQTLQCWYPNTRYNVHIHILVFNFKFVTWAFTFWCSISSLMWFCWELMSIFTKIHEIQELTVLKIGHTEKMTQPTMTMLISKHSLYREHSHSGVQFQVWCDFVENWCRYSQKYTKYRSWRNWKLALRSKNRK